MSGGGFEIGVSDTLGMVAVLEGIVWRTCLRINWHVSMYLVDVVDIFHLCCSLVIEVGDSHEMSGEDSSRVRIEIVALLWLITILRSSFEIPEI